MILIHSLSQDFIFISYFKAQNNPRMSARPGFAGLDQVITITKGCFWGNFKIKEIKIDFLTFWDIILGTQLIKVWFLANLATHHLSYRNFLNICRRKTDRYLYRRKKTITERWLKQNLIVTLDLEWRHLRQKKSINYRMAQQIRSNFETIVLL